MNQRWLKSTGIRGTGLAVLFSLASLGAPRSALAGPLDSALYGPGLSDGRGFGVDLSIGGWLGGPRSPQPSGAAAEPPTSSEAEEPLPEQAPAQPKVRLFGSPDSAFGVEILNQTGQQQQRVRLGIPAF